jgi:hypothetical protein
MKFRAIGALALVTTACPAFSETLSLYPVQTGAETVRYQTGIPTLNLETPTGAIEITPAAFDHGHVSFNVGVYNKGAQPSNFGIENISAKLQDHDIAILSSSELQKRAKSRAAWSQVGIALLAGAAAAAASTAHTTQTSYGRFSTPRGHYSWASSYRDNTIGVLGATAAVAGGAVGIVGIQKRLDFTLANLSDEIIQTTTVDPDSSYGGKFVIEKAANIKAPYDVRVVISWNGASYPFVFRATKEGQNVPPPYTTPPGPAPHGAAITGHPLDADTNVPVQSSAPAARAIPTGPASIAPATSKTGG